MTKSSNLFLSIEIVKLCKIRVTYLSKGTFLIFEKHSNILKKLALKSNFFLYFLTLGKLESFVV